MFTLSATHSKLIGIVVVLVIAAAAVGLFASGVMTATAGHVTSNQTALELESSATPVDFIWVATPPRTTTVKIDNTGGLLGGYRSMPLAQEEGDSSTVRGNGGITVPTRATVVRPSDNAEPAP